jgi:hypothetical protein
MLKVKENYFKTEYRNAGTLLNVNAMVKVKGKGKAIPLQTWTGPEVSRRLRLPDFMTNGT